MSESPAAEALRARRSVGLADSGGGSVLLRVTGADRVAFLHRVLTCDVRGIPVGGTVRGLFLTPKGRVLADFLLALLPDRAEILAPAAASPALRGGLAKYVVADDVAMEDRDGRTGLLPVLGPRAAEAASRFVGGPLPAEPAAAVTVGGVHSTAVRGSLAGLPAIWFLLDPPVDGAAAKRFAQALHDSVEKEGGGPVGAAGLGILRVENGIPALGAEATEETLPQECGLGELVSYTKGCFIGQEPVARLQNRGHTNRGLAGLLLEAGAPLPARGDPVLAGEKEVGVATSAAESPSLGRPVVLALLRHEHAAPGTRLTIRSAGGTLPAEVAALPFVR